MRMPAIHGAATTLESHGTRLREPNKVGHPNQPRAPPLPCQPLTMRSKGMALVAKGGRVKERKFFQNAGCVS